MQKYTHINPLTTALHLVRFTSWYVSIVEQIFYSNEARILCFTD